MTLFALPPDQTSLEALRTRLKLQFQHGALPTQEDYYLMINLLCDCVLAVQPLQAPQTCPESKEAIQMSADDPLFLALEQRDEEIEQRLQSLQMKLDGLDQQVLAAAPAAEAIPAASLPDEPAQAPSVATPEVETLAAGEMETIGKAVVGDAQVVGVELVPAESSPPASAPASDESDADVSRREEAAEAAMELPLAVEPSADAAEPDLAAQKDETKMEPADAVLAETHAEPTAQAEASLPESEPSIAAASAPAADEAVLAPEPAADAMPSAADWAEHTEPETEVAAPSLPAPAEKDEEPSAQAAAMPAEAREDSAPIPVAEARASEDDSEHAQPVAAASAPIAEEASQASEPTAAAESTVPPADTEPAAAQQDEPGKPASALRRLFDTLRGQ